MIKRFLYFILFIIIFAQAAFTQEIFKVTSVNLDTSNSLLFLTSPDNTTDAIMKNVKVIKLQNPKRVYFDIDSAILASPAENWFLNTGGVKQIRVNQFSTNPSKIRVVLYLDDDFNPAKITFFRANNNIIIKFKSNIGSSQYYQNTYRDERSSGSDFYENLSISSEEIDKVKIAINAPASDEVLSQIQTAFNSSTAPPVSINAVSAKTPEAIKKELKLKSKYYLNSITPKTNGFLVSGFGVVGIERPMYLTNPARVVYDIPNTLVNPDASSKEYKIGEDSIKISQYMSNKARIVITSNRLEKYYPIFSSDGQTIFFANTEALDLDSLFSKTTDAVSYNVKATNALTDEFTISFHSPVVHSIKRDYSNLTVNFYNALRYNDQTFQNTIAQTGLSEIKMDLLPKIGLKLSLPLEKDSVVNSYLSADGKSVKVIVKGVKKKPLVCNTERTIVLPKCNGKKSVVLDAGHGGGDYGAIREGINEKDINLDMAKRVQAILASKGVIVEMSRDRDEFVELPARTAFCDAKDPNIFVSVHVNSSVKPDISGIETHYYHQESLELAQTVHASLISGVKAKDRGIFKSKFYVINHTQVPAILVEIGFLSNAQERIELVSEARKQQTAKAIAEGILKYLNNK